MDQKTRPLKKTIWIQQVLHRPVEPARLFRSWPAFPGEKQSCHEKFLAEKLLHIT